MTRGTGTGRARVGISGWRYPAWRGRFYPDDLPQRRELDYAARTFSTIELNGTFYSLQRPDSFRAWEAAAPEGFRFAVKGGRYITHMLQLRDVDDALATFYAQGVLALGGKLGPFLWQLPARMRFDRCRVEAFMDSLPTDTVAASRLARRRVGSRLKGRAVLTSSHEGSLRHAFEVRHPSFLDAGFADLLRARNMALVVADSAGQWPCVEEVTADFMYVRLHGDTELYASGYGATALDDWARRVRAWRRGTQPRGARRITRTKPPRVGRDVYVFFDNDAKAHAPFDALQLARRIGDDARRVPGDQEGN